VLAKVRADVLAGEVGLPADPELAPTLGELIDDWLKRRKLTNRAGAEDGYRWHKHLAPFFGHLRPAEISHAEIRRFTEGKLGKLNPATIRICVSLLSSLFVDLQERHLADHNPARGLPPSLSRLMRPTYDPRTTPFLERVEDIRRVHLALPEPLHMAFAVGALGGLRTGEVFALRWSRIDLEARRIHVRESVKGPLKDKDSRIVPIMDSLLPILKAWKLETGGAGLFAPPMRKDGDHIDRQTPGTYLRLALVKLGLMTEHLDHPKLWYSCTRHTFASQWVMAGGSIEKLKEMLGHYSVVVTERYAHLRPELFTAKDLATVSVDLTPGGAPPTRVDVAKDGRCLAGAADAIRASARKH
jgi:integrase